MKTYTITTISQMFDIPASTLRYYESIGLLSNVGRHHNQRVYTDCHIQRLHAIECFKNTGLSISKMLAFFAYEKNLETNIDDILTLVTDHEKSILSQIEQMQKDLLHIQKKVTYYTAIKEAINTNSAWPDWDEV